MFGLALAADRRREAGRPARCGLCLRDWVSSGSFRLAGFYGMVPGSARRNAPRRRGSAVAGIRLRPMGWLIAPARPLIGRCPVLRRRRVRTGARLVLAPAQVFAKRRSEASLPGTRRLAAWIARVCHHGSIRAQAGAAVQGNRICKNGLGRKAALVAICSQAFESACERGSDAILVVMAPIGRR